MTKTLSAVLILIAGFIGGIFLMPQPTAPRLVPTVDAPMANQGSCAAEMELLREETASLRRELQELGLRIDLMGSGSLRREPLDGFVSQNDFNALAEKLGERATFGSSDEGLKVKVEETLQEIRRKENDERGTRKIQERIAWASEWLGLDAAQQALYEEMIHEEQRDGRELGELWKSGSLTAEEGGQMKAENGRRHLDNVASMLSPQQLETFNNAFGKQRRASGD
jgi:hypothetical protein